MLCGVLTLCYAIFVASRWISSGDSPGLSTLNASGALIAIWLYFPIRYRERHGPRFAGLRASLLGVLGFVAAVEWMDAARALSQSGAVHLLPAASAFVFTLVFRQLLVDLLNPKQASGSRSRSPGRSTE